LVPVATQVEVRVAPRVEFARAAQRLASAHLRAALARMMDEHDGNAVSALELAQVREQRGDLAGVVLVDAVQAHERIEDQEPRAQFGDGLGERVAVALDVEPHRGRGDDLDVEVSERATSGARDAREPLAHDVERVLGGEEQYPAGARDGEAPHTGRARGDRHGEVEREEGLAALRLAADDSDGLITPQLLDEPATIE